ncbi:MAG: sugar-binding domain-containing protein [Blautia obeum]
MSKEQITSRLSEVSAYYLDSVVKEKMVVGISWGNTLYHIVKYIDANNKKNIPITVGSDYGCLKCETSGTGCHGSGKRPGFCIRWNISVYLCPPFCEK